MIHIVHICNDPIINFVLDKDPCPVSELFENPTVADESTDTAFSTESRSLTFIV